MQKQILYTFLHTLLHFCRRRDLNELVITSTTTEGRRPHILALFATRSDNMGKMLLKCIDTRRIHYMMKQIIINTHSINHGTRMKYAMDYDLVPVSIELLVVSDAFSLGLIMRPSRQHFFK